MEKENGGTNIMVYYFQIPSVYFGFVTVIVFYNYLVFSCHFYYTVV